MRDGTNHVKNHSQIRKLSSINYSSLPQTNDQIEQSLDASLGTPGATTQMRHASGEMAQEEYETLEPR